MMKRVAQVYFLFGIFIHVCYSDLSWDLPDNSKNSYKINLSKYKFGNICDDNISKTKLVGGSISQQKCYEYEMKRKCKGNRFMFETNPMDYPHMAAVGTKSKNGKFILHCAGALISPNFVLSAYNCYIEPYKNIIYVSPTIVKLGATDIQKEYKTAMTVKIKQIIKHPMQKGDDNNLALVKLNQAVEFSKFIQPACLSTVETMDHSPISTTGWYFYNGIQNNESKVSRHVIQSGTIVLKRTYSIININKEYLTIKTYSKQNLPKKMFFTDKIYINGVASYPARTGGTLQLHFSSSKRKLSFYTLLAVLSQPKLNNTNNNSIYHLVKGKVLYTAIEPYIDWIEHIVWPEYTYTQSYW